MATSAKPTVLGRAIPLLAALCAIAVTTACGGRHVVSEQDSAPDAGGDGDADTDADVGGDADADVDDGGEPDADDAGPECGVEELCGDGVDNDCDGVIDEGCIPEGCLCLPGSARWCRLSGEDEIGRQECLDDGSGWGPCLDGSWGMPAECSDGGTYSERFQLCMSLHGSCLEDVSDLDLDGDTTESLGACGDVLCRPAGCLCVPGTSRFCDNPAYTYGGVQYCENDGLSWGPCEWFLSRLPRACDGMYNEALEACLIDHGFCTQDLFDVDGDGDVLESLGGCSGVLCEEG